MLTRPCCLIFGAGILIGVIVILSVSVASHAAAAHASLPSDLPRAAHAVLADGLGQVDNAFPAPSLIPTFGSLGNEFQISTTPYADRPAVAYNRNRGEYLVVWCANGNLLYGQRVSRNATLAGTAFFINTGNCNPAVAYNGANDQYLVVWSVDWALGEKEIFGKIISWDGSPISTSAFSIWYWPQRCLDGPRAAWNSVRNEYFVIWNAMDASSNVPTDISGTHISASGGLEGVAHHLVDWTAPNVYPYSPDADIAYNPTTNQYYLVWRTLQPVESGYHPKEIMGARVDADGSLQWPVNVLNDDWSGDQQSPRVATNGTDRYFVIWTDVDWYLLKSRIGGRQVYSNGSVLGVWVTMGSWADLMYLGPPAVAALAGASHEFLAVWQMPTDLGNGIIGSDCRMDDPLQPSCSPFVVRISTNWNQNFIASPAMAVGGCAYLIAYPAEIVTTGEQNIYGRLWVPPAMFLPLIRR
jgi:hypothetical protein